MLYTAARASTLALIPLLATLPPRVNLLPASAGSLDRRRPDLPLLFLRHKRRRRPPSDRRRRRRHGQDARRRIHDNSRRQSRRPGRAVQEDRRRRLRRGEAQRHWRHHAGPRSTSTACCSRSAGTRSSPSCATRCISCSSSCLVPGRTWRTR
ncbi:hypothetical protein MRB53_041400 [Persea americana]|nr:hypothetical protein MRB53_041400 [Persea americana]